ncbi:N-6 DNA methylase [Methanothermococcus sp. Ax23]|uniref:type I restriction-modification system subunit M n=1 Tax=Methanothermococcus sp. Ax23 TaxID=3156486 RepID=UPI003BA042E8
MKRESIVKSEVKSACDILRKDDGTSGAMDYMEQLSWLLFLKVFESVEKELEETALMDGREYIPIIDKKYRWSNWAKRDWIGKPKESLKDFVDDVDEEIKEIEDLEDTLVYFIDNILFPYLRSLEGTPGREKIASIFKEISGNKMKSTYNLVDVINKIDNINTDDYEDTHVLSQIYEELLLNMGNEAGWGGEFYTPRPIIRFIINVIKPKIGEKVFDPFGGSAGFLIEVLKYIQNELGELMTVQEHETLMYKTLYGHEKKPFPYLLGTMNMVLHGILTPNYYRRNSLGDEDVHNVPESEKYDIIITNPPFGGRENKKVQDNFPHKIQSTEALALQYIMRKLKNGGRAGVILPEGQIMFGGGKFKTIREELLNKFNVFAIVSLPQGVFSQMGAGVKTNIVFFEKTGKTKEIWYYELEGKYTKKQRIKDEDFEDVLNKIKNREISENSWIVSIDEIKKRDYDLTAKNPNKKEEIEYKEPNEVVKEIEEIDVNIKNIIEEIKSNL